MDKLTKIQVLDEDFSTKISLGNKIGRISFEISEEAKSIFSDLLRKENNPLRKGILDIYNFVDGKIDKIEINNVIDGIYTGRVYIDDNYYFDYVDIESLTSEILSFTPNVSIEERLLDCENYDDIKRNNLNFSELVPNIKNSNVNFVEKDFQEFKIKKVEKNKDIGFLTYNIIFSDGEYEMDILYPQILNKKRIKPMLERENILSVEDFSGFYFIDSIDILNYYLEKNDVEIKKIYLMDDTMILNKNKISINSPLETNFLEFEKNGKNKKILTPNYIAMNEALKLGSFYLTKPEKNVNVTEESNIKGYA